MKIVFYIVSSAIFFLTVVILLRLVKKYLAALYNSNFYRFSHICKNKKGFTLIELLIVIVVAMILSMVAVNSFTAHRQVAVLDLSQDFVTSLISQSKAKASHGRNSSSGDAACFGLHLERGKNGLTVVEWPYDSRDFVEDGQYKIGRCKENASALKRDFQLFDEDVSITGIFLGEDMNNQNELLLMFEPPSGDFDRTFADKLVSSVEKRSFAKIVLQSESGKERSFKIDLDSGLVAKDQ